jgi:uncharacterized protein
LAKPGGAICSLDCKYCLYLSKELLYVGDRFRTVNELLNIYIRRLLQTQPIGDVNIAWQGGDPTLMGIEFFRLVLQCVEHHRKIGQNVLHSVHTTGTLLDDQWCRLFKQHNVVVGLNIDGPPSMHDAYRADRAGHGIFEAAIRGYDLLRRHEVEVNILCAIHAANAEHPLEVYRFIRDRLKTGYLQLVPLVERTLEDQLYMHRGGRVTERSVGTDQFGRFLVAIFDEWAKRDVGKVFVQTFDVALGSLLGHHDLCVFSPTRGNAVAMERNGNVYSCDRYFERKSRLPNIRETPMGEFLTSTRRRMFGQNKPNSLAQHCWDCSVLIACDAQCPRNRFIPAQTTESGLNYLCAGYKLFLDHINPAMKTMAKWVRENGLVDEGV